MVYFLKVEKDGIIKEEQVNTLDELYKKCNLRKSQGFDKVSEFTDDVLKVELWGRTIGRVNIKNLYTFPVDLDKTIYGTCALVAIVNDKLCDLQLSQWDKLCENLYTNNAEESGQEESESDNDSIIKAPGDDTKNVEAASDLESMSDSSEYSDSELKEDDYLYSSEEEEEEEADDDEKENNTDKN